MIAGRPEYNRKLLYEISLTCLVLIGLANCINRFLVDGKLPQPFIFDINDTFMDWFNTAYWAHNSGAFDNWQTVYPPLSFVFLKVFGLASCYTSNSVTARDCDYVGRIVIACTYILSALFAWISFRRNDPKTSLFRGLSFGLGLPLLFTLERGNLILPCFIFFAIGHGKVFKSKLLRVLGIAISINFKPYLMLPVLANLFRRKWRFLEICAVATVAVYIITFGVLGDGSPIQLYRNTINWVSFSSGLVWEQIYYSTSYAPFLEFNSARFPTRDFIPYFIIDGIVLVVPILINISRILGAICLVGAWLQPTALSRVRISIILLSVSLIGQSPGGYTEVFLVFLLFHEKWEKVGPIIALMCGYLLCVPYDYVIANFITLSGDSWLGGRPVTSPFGISVGIFLRPGLIIIMCWALALDSIALLIGAHRSRGPSSSLRPDFLKT